jgi:peptidoglycan hydrolase-like protein with peptidoglycan-binding domain
VAFSILRLGSRGSDVKTLQEQLNAKLRPSPMLVTDGIFGGLTRNAVLRFQQMNWLVEDGEVGACTWNAATDGEAYQPILHTISFIPQPTATTCWAASTAMVTRSVVPTVIARTPSDLILPDGSLRNFSDTNDSITGSARFARAHGMMVVPPTSWPPSALVRMLSRGALIFDMLWDASNYAQGAGSPGHMIAVVGIRGDNDQSGRGTTLRIYDPWAPNVGKRYSVGYFKWINEVPTRTYHIFHKA